MKKIASTALIASFALFLGGCAATLGGAHGDLPKQYPATVEEWAGDTIDRVEFFKPYTLNSYQSVAIQPVDTLPVRIPNDNTGPAVEKALKRVTEVYAAGIKSTMPGFAVNVVPAGTAPTGSLVLRSKLTELSPGSQAARYFVGYGAGRTLTQIEGELVDPATNTVFLKFIHAKASGVGTFGGGYDELINNDVTDVGKDVGRLIGAAYENGKAK